MNHTRLSLSALALGTLLSLGACSIVREPVTGKGLTLADLEAPILPAVRAQIDNVSLSELEASYRAALEVTADSQERQRILVRLADLEMAKSEQQQVENTAETEHFESAIEQINALLGGGDTDTEREVAIDSITDERLLYRLAKAYAMDGRMAESNQALEKLESRYPQSPYAVEARFRMAEFAFSNGDYDRARGLYREVVDAGHSTPFYTNAQYMLGWSEFKDSRYRASLAPFTQVLDELVPADGNLESLTDSNRALVTDTLRVMGITFSYLDGADAITEVYQELGERPYQHLIYQELGEFYLSKDRYADAAGAFETYMGAFPANERAPEFALERLEVLKKGGLSDEVLAGKEKYVASFGPTSSYWAGLPPEQRDELIKPTLLQFLDELSSFYHAKAQALQAAARDYDKQAAAGKKPKQRPDPAAPAFVQAANYYQQFIDVFPEHETVAEKTFLMAEAYHEAGELERALAAYRKVGFEWVDLTFGARAAYNTIVTIDEILQQAKQQADNEQVPIWREQKIQAEIDFADFYPGEPRATEVLAEAADTLFQQQDFERASQLATRLTQWQPPPALEIQKSAWLILAHIYFDAERYAEAEAAYREVLARTALDDPQRGAVVERIAASMYQSAEQKMAAGLTDDAVAQFLAIQGTAPDSEIAIKAQYDAAGYLLEQQQWQRSERLFRDFKVRYPNHSLSKTLAPKFALIYQELEMWDLAAVALDDMAAGSNDPDVKRQSMYLAAELYQKSGRETDAVKTYEKYLKAYPQPFDLATEARYQLLQMARTDKQRNYWLNQLIDADRRAGGSSTERARYLAAYASNQFALQEFNNFESIKLTLPIKKSLSRKKKALESTLDAYKQVIDYDVAEFVTEANYRIGNVYSQLSRDLLNSERPKGLDDLAMEQYEILLEEQAYPFEEKSVELLATNAERAWDGFYDKWVKQSLAELAKLLPARYGKEEKAVEVSNGLL